MVCYGDYDKRYTYILRCILIIKIVGFGDIYPKTNPGRLISLIICIWGVIMVSIMVVALKNLLILRNVDGRVIYRYVR